ncbi:MAG TPA: DUF3168 domain-containing protein [Dissulfurispiraceae bacterium]|nr:DUF3168 domain-containing protein [Dissulfurispiraceae bacterium]
MKALTTSIYGKLAGSSLDTLIGGRMFKGRAPENTEFPYAVYFVVSDVPDLTFTEHFEDVLLQFSLFSSTSSTTEIEDMYTALKSLYDECALTITGATLVWMKRANTQFMVEDVETPDGTSQIYHYAVDYDIKTSLD